MKKVLILFDEERWGNKNLFADKKYQHCYEYFYKLARKRGIFMCRASYQWYDSKKRIFKYAWTFQKNEWERIFNIKPDLLYDKTKFSPKVHYRKEQMAENYKIVNDIEFTLLAGHKFFASLVVPEFFKKYHKVSNLKELKEATVKIGGEKIVLKPAIGSGGENVIIIDKKKAANLKINKPFLVQEFIDSSTGIKGITKNTHDLRLVFANNGLIYSYIRVPAKGSLLANIAKGGTMHIVPRKKIPKSVFPVVRKVQEVFSFYHPKTYTIDLMFDEKQKPWIVELNTMPGIYFTSDQKKWQDRFYLDLIKIFKKEIESGKSI
ncbi:MAG: hypothetical protein A3J76_02390 [Candidatus Moranbacteria bacterium RBG_13_45_13]|nr:MAG: hypothetical protein A3J76_02390 [Candidatus Moranbacteria bacterium RBG_13_45_13]